MLIQKIEIPNSFNLQILTVAYPPKQFSLYDMEVL